MAVINSPTTLSYNHVGANATFVQGDVEFDVTSLQQQAPLTGLSDSANLQLFYENYGWSVKVTYTWRDKFLSAYDAGSFAMPRGIYRKPEQSLDFQFSYNVTDEFVLTFDATNILDDIYQEYYEDSVLYNRTNSIYTRTFALGARYSF